ncbi:trypsin-like peptidase domain-containing protein [Pontibacillus sp. ALD_SL1]|uniref:S1C family serine protease n=1 Tax=Pontibacillus sp. ALD_SL1 TaxID=2777185 RepID=UPI001A957122|nr:trypsin-like peptidase domain-containing protein [Pontibacillus sp. ALD_SL1]QST01386.1 trypsin-like peptidase domain-containing protein [Pontibacillus sp. ALD_SL1]
MEKNSKRLPITFTFFIVAIAAIALVSIYKTTYKDPIKKQSALAQEVNGSEQLRQIDLKTLIHEAEKSVVQIEASDETESSIGSGFVFNEKGDVVTNAHVVKGYDSVFIKTTDARMYPAAVIGVGTEKDIALLRVPQLSNRSPMNMDLKEIGEIGDDIIAVGSPLGLQNTVTMGTISGTDREFTINDFTYHDAYQISAPITHGNSGGPLIHKKTGKVLAINSAGTEQGAIGFSLPLQNVKDQLDKWSKDADSKDLTYESFSENRNLTESQLKEDAKYLVHYFHESLLMRDYISAYSMLGSAWQSKQSYQEFRDQYIHTIDIDLSDLSLNVNAKNQVKVTLEAKETVHKKSLDNNQDNDNQERITKTYVVTFLIGYENDQLKLLRGSKEQSSAQ